MGLFDLFKNIPTVGEITGSFGEWLTKNYAKSFPGTLILHDILIDGAKDFKSQIDVLIIGSKGIYVIEVKSFPDAKIYGNTTQQKWSYYNFGKKYEIYSPIKQNQKHVKHLKNFLCDFGDVPCFSIITMICEDFKISGEYPSDTAVCNSLPAMKRAILKIAENHEEIWDDAKKQQIYDYIKENQYATKADRKEHKENVVAYKNSLDTLENQKVCPYCKIPLVLKNGKYGDFYGCSNYPKCKYTLKK